MNLQASSLSHSPSHAATQIPLFVKRTVFLLGGLFVSTITLLLVSVLTLALIVSQKVSTGNFLPGTAHVNPVQHPSISTTHKIATPIDRAMIVLPVGYEDRSMNPGWTGIDHKAVMRHMNLPLGHKVSTQETTDGMTVLDAEETQPILFGIQRRQARREARQSAGQAEAFEQGYSSACANQQAAQQGSCQCGPDCPCLAAAGYSKVTYNSADLQAARSQGSARAAVDSTVSRAMASPITYEDWGGMQVRVVKVDGVSYPVPDSYSAESKSSKETTTPPVSSSPPPPVNTFQQTPTSAYLPKPVCDCPNGVCSLEARAKYQRDMKAYLAQFNVSPQELQAAVMPISRTTSTNYRMQIPVKYSNPYQMNYSNGGCRGGRCG